MNFALVAAAVNKAIGRNIDWVRKFFGRASEEISISAVSGKSYKDATIMMTGR